MTKEEYFKSYPSSKECFQTSDGFFFHKDFDAKAHAQSLKEREVIEHKRPETKEDVVAEIEKPVSEPTPIGKKAVKKE